MEDKMVFDDLDLREVEVVIKNVNYILREADGATAAKYRSAAVQGSRFSQKTKDVLVGPGIGDVELVLLSGCLLFKENGRRVPEGTIRAWPSRIITQLFNRAKQISELEEDDDTIESLEAKISELQEKLSRLREDALGNAQSSTMDGSA